MRPIAGFWRGSSRIQSATISTVLLELEWEDRNQARMHMKNGDSPYGDTEDGLRYFLETAICARQSPGARAHMNS